MFPRSGEYESEHRSRSGGSERTDNEDTQEDGSKNQRLGRVLSSRWRRFLGKTIDRPRKTHHLTKPTIYEVAERYLKRSEDK